MKLEQEDLRVLREGFNRRFRNLLKRSEKYGVKPPDKEEVWAKLVEHYKNGFFCEYCGKEMKLKGGGYEGNKDVWSIEHKRPLSEGGDNSMDNITFVCHQCNLVKGTLSSEIYVHLLEILRKDDVQFMRKYLDEAYRAALANKIDRVKSEEVHA